MRSIFPTGRDESRALSLPTLQSPAAVVLLLLTIFTAMGCSPSDRNLEARQYAIEEITKLKQRVGIEARHRCDEAIKQLTDAPGDNHPHALVAQVTLAKGRDEKQFLVVSYLNQMKSGGNVQLRVAEQGKTIPLDPPRMRGKENMYRVLIIPRKHVEECTQVDLNDVVGAELSIEVDGVVSNSIKVEDARGIVATTQALTE
ncbi:MAG: hypothetical protein NTW19_12295 [Planctomycetota bacterium]|nr:hypothetical protein [Planctomycetota bacterium]